MEVLINEAKLQKRIEELARKIEKDYEGKEIVLLGILKGSVPFLWELAKRIKNDMQLEFIEVSSYEGTESTGKIKLNKDIGSSIEGKEVIIVEDIIDSGNTLHYLVEILYKRKPNSIKICTLLDKPERRTADVKVDYSGFNIPDEFVVGYGLDYAQKYRNLPFIGVVEFTE